MGFFPCILLATLLVHARHSVWYGVWLLRRTLHCAAQSFPFRKRDVIEHLLEQYPEAASMVDTSGKLPLHLACENDASSEVIMLLLGHHYEGSHNGLDLPDYQGRTPLHYLRQGHQANALELILERYPAGIAAGANVADNDGMLPVHAAVHGRADTVVVRLLLEANHFSVPSKTHRGLTPAGRWSPGPFSPHNPFSGLIDKTHRGLTPLELTSRTPVFQTETKNLLTQKQDEAVRLIRNAILDTLDEFGLPDLVVATICSFFLPEILTPTRDELTWESGIDRDKWQHFLDMIVGDY